MKGGKAKPKKGKRSDSAGISVKGKPQVQPVPQSKKVKVKAAGC